MDYYEQLHDDIIEVLEENGIELSELCDSAKFSEVYDFLYSLDSVTGTASGSYTFSSYEASQNVTDNYDLLQECVDNGFMTVEDVGRAVLCGDFEGLDVSIRCNLLHFVLSEIAEKQE